MTTSAFDKIAAALAGAGIKLGDTSGITSPDEFARLVECACRNFAAGKQDRERHPEDDDRDPDLEKRVRDAMRE